MTDTLSIVVKQKREVVEGPLYKTTNTVESVTGIEKEIFVMNTETQAFEHVATVYDMYHLLNTRSAAQTAEDEYYRASVAIKSYESLDDALEFASYTLGRVGYLAEQYDEYTNHFAGEDEHTYPGEG